MTISGNVESIDSCAFKDCVGLKNVKMPDSVTSIGRSAFEGCISLENINMPDSITSIETNAFSHCSDLTDVIIPKTDIISLAFDYCIGLKNIAIPNSIKKIDSGAFNGCKSITDVYYGGSEDEWNAINIRTANSDLTDATIHFNSTMPEPEQEDVVIDNAVVEKTATGYKITVTLEEAPTAKCALITALYKEGESTGLATKAFTSDTAEQTIEVAADTSDTARIFIWDSLEGMRPLCGAQTVNITQ